MNKHARFPDASLQLWLQNPHIALRILDRKLFHSFFYFTTILTNHSLTFKEVKAHAIYYLLELEKLGKITRSDGFQGILNAIAGDVRSKHRKRLLRQQEMENMNGALKDLADRKRYFEEQINSYHDYVDAAMATMQRGKRLVSASCS